MAKKNFNAWELQQKVNEVDNKAEQTYVDEKVNTINSSLEEKANKTTTDNIQTQVNNLVLGAIGDGNNPEVVQARDVFPLLNDRLSFFADKLGVELTIIDGGWTYPRGYDSGGNQTTNSAMTGTNILQSTGKEIIVVSDTTNYLVQLVKYDTNRTFLSKTNITSNITYIDTEGYYALCSYPTVIVNPITEEVATACKSNVSIAKTESIDIVRISDFVSSLDTGLEDAIHVNTPYVTNSNVQKRRVETRSYTKFPLYPVWGHEYLTHWYKKLYNVETCKIVSDGDSITEGYDAQGTYTDAFKDMRGKALKRIMKAGNFDMTKLTVFNNGKSGTSTNDWIGNQSFMINSLLNSGVDYTNGKLHYSMAENPDLLIVSFGMNDSAIGGFDSTNQTLKYNLTSRLQLFESNYREGLQRIRGNVAVNGRESYNKSVDDLSIILTTPTVTSMDTLTWHDVHDYEKWHMYVREIIMGLAREFKCGYADFTARTYGHIDTDFNNWSVFNADDSNYRFHPNIYSNMQFHSLLQDLIYPVCLWNLNVD